MIPQTLLNVKNMLDTVLIVLLCIAIPLNIANVILNIINLKNSKRK